MKTLRVFIFSLMMGFLGCKDQGKSLTQTLPILGETIKHPLAGKPMSYQAPEFSLKDQQGNIYSNTDLEGKVHVVDFFFTSCPTICPKMTAHLKTVQDHFKGNDRVALISYSIDGRNDTSKVLETYAKNHEINRDYWTLLTGNPEDIFEISKRYKVMAFDDSLGKERNLIHDGTFVLMDGQQRVRGYYNGLELEDTKRLIRDMEQLLKTM